MSIIQFHSITSQHRIALTYAAKVCQGLGGVYFDGNVQLVIPAWAEVPWNRHGWLRRLRIRLTGS